MGSFPLLDLSENVSETDNALLLLVLRDSSHLCRVFPYHSALVEVRGSVPCLLIPLLASFLVSYLQ
jgi:hypothetical protein